MANKDSSKPRKIFKFGKRSIEALPTPARGERAIYRDQLNKYLKLRVTHSERTFFWQRTIKSKQHTVTIDTFSAITAETARDRADVIAARYTMGEDVEAEAREARSQLTLGELWADFRINRKRGQGRISEAHEYVYNRHFKPWEKKKVSNISYNMGRKLIMDIRKNAPIHGNRVHRLGKAIWNHGINELRMKIENPFTFSQVSEKGRSRKNFRLQRTDMRVFMEGLDALPGDNMKDLFLSSLFTGRRIGECKAMRWVDVNLESGLWVIPDTKSGESQTCVLPKPMVDLLTERKPKGKSKSEWIFAAHSKSGHVEAINTAWEMVRKETGFTHLQARDLRGTLASWLQEAGVPLVGAQQQLGHADIATTAGSYTTISHSLQRIGLDSATAAMLEAAK
jgi:integrase